MKKNTLRNYEIINADTCDAMARNISPMPKANAILAAIDEAVADIIGKTVTDADITRLAELKRAEESAFIRFEVSRIIHDAAESLKVADGTNTDTEDFSNRIYAAYSDALADTMEKCEEVYPNAAKAIADDSAFILDSIRSLVSDGAESLAAARRTMIDNHHEFGEAQDAADSVSADIEARRLGVDKFYNGDEVFVTIRFTNAADNALSAAKVATKEAKNKLAEEEMKYDAEVESAKASLYGAKLAADRARADAADHPRSKKMKLAAEVADHAVDVAKNALKAIDSDEVKKSRLAAFKAEVDAKKEAEKRAEEVAEDAAKKSARIVAMCGALIDERRPSAFFNGGDKKRRGGIYGVFGKVIADLGIEVAELRVSINALRMELLDAASRVIAKRTSANSMMRQATPTQIAIDRAARMGDWNYPDLADMCSEAKTALCMVAMSENAAGIVKERRDSLMRSYEGLSILAAADMENRAEVLRVETEAKPKDAAKEMNARLMADEEGNCRSRLYAARVREVAAILKESNLVLDMTRKTTVSMECGVDIKVRNRAIVRLAEAKESVVTAKNELKNIMKLRAEEEHAASAIWESKRIYEEARDKERAAMDGIMALKNLIAAKESFIAEEANKKFGISELRAELKNAEAKENNALEEAKRAREKALEDAANLWPSVNEIFEKYSATKKLRASLESYIEKRRGIIDAEELAGIAVDCRNAEKNENALYAAYIKELRAIKESMRVEFMESEFAAKAFDLNAEERKELRVKTMCRRIELSKALAAYRKFVDTPELRRLSDELKERRIELKEITAEKRAAEKAYLAARNEAERVASREVIDAERKCKSRAEVLEIGLEAWNMANAEESLVNAAESVYLANRSAYRAINNYLGDCRAIREVATIKNINAEDLIGLEAAYDMVTDIFGNGNARFKLSRRDARRSEIIVSAYKELAGVLTKAQKRALDALVKCDGNNVKAAKMIHRDEKAVRLHKENIMKLFAAAIERADNDSMEFMLAKYHLAALGYEGAEDKISYAVELLEEARKFAEAMRDKEEKAESAERANAEAKELTDAAIVRNAIANAITKMPEGARKVALFYMENNVSQRKAADALGKARGTLRELIKCACRYIAEEIALACPNAEMQVKELANASKLGELYKLAA